MSSIFQQSRQKSQEIFCLYSGQKQVYLFAMGLSTEQRTAILDEFVAQKLMTGRFDLISRTPLEAVFRSTRKTSHVLHLILSVITLGLWIPIWITMSLVNSKKTLRVYVDEDGTI